MSLQVWLPLTKDLRQQGLLQTPALSLNAFTQESGGKLGQYCYTDRGIIHFTEDFLANQWSLACWVKSTSWSANNDIILCKNASESTNSQFYLSIINGTSFNLGINGGSSNGAGGYSYTFSTNTWYHVAATYNGTNYAMYINGNRVKSGTCTTTKPTGLLNLGIGCRSTNAGGTASTGNANKRLNDVRIYNHCLSPMEVKELAKGLVLHYPLNRQGWGQENLLLNTNSSITWNGTVSSSGSTVKDFYKTQIPVPSLFAVDELVTISFDWSTTATTGNLRVECGVVTPWVWGTVISSSGKGNRSSASNYVDLSSSVTSGHLIVTFKITSNQTGAAETLQWLRIRKDGTEGETFSFTMSNAKVERGSIATPWCPNSSDALATTMGLNSTTEYDCSGFCNNGIRTGTFGWTSDTPKYSVSTNFAAVGTVTNNTIPIHLSNEFTIAWWGKVNSWKKSWEGMFLLQNSAALNAGLNTYDIMSTIHASTANSMGLTICQNGSSYAFDKYKWTYTIGTWAHYTCTYKAGAISIYQNGVLVYTETITDNSSNDYYYRLGGRARACDCQMSDFRIYATALSAEDVKSLYQNSAYIDSSGNVYGAVHSEV